MNAITSISLIGLMAVGYIIAYVICYRRKDRLGMLNGVQVHGLCIVYMIAGLAAIVVFSFIENLIRGNGFNYSGISLYGIYMLMPIFLFIYSKLSKNDYFQVMDMYAIAALPCLFLGRVNCLIQGCCYGKLIPGTTFRWPTRELELAYIIFMFAFLLRLCSLFY